MPGTVLGSGILGGGIQTAQIPAFVRTQSINQQYMDI